MLSEMAARQAKAKDKDYKPSDSEGLAARDPAAVVGKVLKPVPRGRKWPAIVSIVALYDMIRKTEAELASPLTKLASRFAALTAQRLIVESLNGSWRQKKGMCCCPAHDDRTPSMSVTLGRKAILFHCFAGCSNEEVIAALDRQGVRSRDLFEGFGAVR